MYVSRTELGYVHKCPRGHHHPPIYPYPYPYTPPSRPEPKQVHQNQTPEPKHTHSLLFLFLQNMFPFPKKKASTKKKNVSTKKQNASTVPREGVNKRISRLTVCLFCLRLVVCVCSCLRRGVRSMCRSKKFIPFSCSIPSLRDTAELLPRKGNYHSYLLGLPAQSVSTILSTRTNKKNKPHR